MSNSSPRVFVYCLLIASAIFGQLVLSQPVFAEARAATSAPEADQPIADPEQGKAAADTGSSGKDDAVRRTYNEDALKHYNRGVELHQTGFLNQAIAEYRAAIEADDRLEQAWSNLGGIYAAQKSYTKAIESFQKALMLKPDRPTTLNGFGTVLYAKGKIEDAKEKWLQAIKVDPKFASAYYNMGTALEYEKRMPEAIGTFVKALQVNPAMADAYYRVGAIYFKEGHWAQAHTMLKKAVDLEPDAEWVRDAKKSLTYLDNSFASEPREREVKMNVVSPGARLDTEKAPGPAVQEKSPTPEPTKSTNSTVHRAATNAPKPSADAEPTSVASSTDSDTTSDNVNKKSGLLSRPKKEREPKPPRTPKEPKPAKEPKPPKEPKVHKEKEHKEHKEKKPDMFVQPDSSETEPADLKAKPEAAN